MEEEKNRREGRYHRRPGAARSGAARRVDRRVCGAAESGVESRRREGARRGIYFTGGREEREQRGGKTIPVPSYRSLDDDT